MPESESTFLVDWEDGGPPETYRVPPGYTASPERNQVALCPQCRGEAAISVANRLGEIMNICPLCAGRGVIALVAVVPDHPPTEEPG